MAIHIFLSPTWVGESPSRGNKELRPGYMGRQTVFHLIPFGDGLQNPTHQSLWKKRYQVGKEPHEANDIFGRKLISKSAVDGPSREMNTWEEWGEKGVYFTYRRRWWAQPALLYLVRPRLILTSWLPSRQVNLFCYNLKRGWRSSSFTLTPPHFITIISISGNFLVWDRKWWDDLWQTDIRGIYECSVSKGPRCTRFACPPLPISCKGCGTVVMEPHTRCFLRLPWR